MTKAEEFSSVTPSLFFWQAYDAACRTDVSCCAHLVNGKLVLVDPIRLSGAAEEELLLQGEFLGVVLTNGNHHRSAAYYRQKYRIPLAGHPEAEADLGVSFDQLATDGEVLFGGLRVIDLEGAGPGEIGLYRPESDVLTLGDVIINLPDHGFSILPDKYCQNPEMARQSLAKLKSFSPKILTFAHGMPIVSKAEARLNQLVEIGRFSSLGG